MHILIFQQQQKQISKRTVQYNFFLLLISYFKLINTLRCNSTDSRTRTRNKLNFILIWLMKLWAIRKSSLLWKNPLESRLNDSGLKKEGSVATQRWKDDLVCARERLGTDSRGKASARAGKRTLVQFIVTNGPVGEASEIAESSLLYNERRPNHISLTREMQTHTHSPSERCAQH